MAKSTKLTRCSSLLVQAVLLLSMSGTLGSATEVEPFAKRAESSSQSVSSTATSTRTSSSSSSSTKSSKTAKCTGSKSSCQKPYNTTALAVGLTIGIPVAIVILVCSVMLYKVYRRNKKEAERDNDPDFEGDIDYLPSMDNPGYQMGSLSQSSNSNTPYEFKENDDNYFPPQPPSHFRTDSNEFYRRSQVKAVDPFILPQVTDESSLRDFAKQLHGEEFGAYKLASNPNSRNASHYSLPFEKGLVRISQNVGSSLTTSLSNDVGNLQRNFTEQTGSSSSTLSQPYPSPVKSTAGEVTQQYVEDHSGFDVEHSRNDTTLDETFSKNQDSSMSKSSRPEISRETFNFEMMNGHDIEYQSPFDDKCNNDIQCTGHQEKDKSTGTVDIPEQNHTADVAEQNRILHLSAEEEENIQRMKSIYKVYLDRNGTIKHAPINDQTAGNEEAVEVEPHGNPAITADYAEPVLKDATHLSIPLDSSSLQEPQNQLQLPEEAHRVASSIYSAAPSQMPQGPAYEELHAPSVPNGFLPPNVGNVHYDHANQPVDNTYAPRYAMQQYPNQGHPYGNQQFFQQQYAHPQTFESIDELPTPTNLPYSSSSHSLTSFKPRAKQTQLTQLQAARINGTALNPMDHPEMFYSHDAYNSYASNGTIQPKAPYQLRQSVVMTNPSELTPVPRFKPAGSIRNVSAMNSRNNSMTTNSNFPPQQAFDPRVSGILNEAYLVQPPSVGGILPHSSSQDDLRKQIGSSHNYNVT